MKASAFFAIAISTSLFLSACGGAAAPTAVPKLTAAPTDAMGGMQTGGAMNSTSSPAAQGNIVIGLKTNPDPLKLGKVEFLITLADAAGKPIEGADVTLSYTMSSMSMGVSKGKAADDGGKYSVKSSLDHAGALVVLVEAERQGQKLGQKEFKINVN